jgi:phosphatidylglycerophosphate synthase
MSEDYTLAQVRASYTPHKAWQEMSGELPAYLLYRPLSFWLTVPLLRLRIPTLAVTALSGLIAVSLPLIAALSATSAWLEVGLLALVFHVLDCVDGNLARTRGTCSPGGALLDAIADQAFWIALLTSLGLMVSRTQHPLAPQAVTLGLGCSVLLLWGRRVRDEARLLSGERVELSAERPAHLSTLDWTIIALGGLENLYGFAILLGGFLGALPTVLVAITVYVAGVFVASVLLSFRRVT